MSNGVFTRMKRFTFVEKTSTEVGDGTAFPMEVTLDQVAEIFYRVKDAVFISGGLNFDLNFGTVESPDIFNETVTSPTTKPSNRIYGVELLVEHGARYFRGYSSNSSEFIPDKFLKYLGEVYSTGMPELGFNEGIDIADNEIALFLPDGQQPLWNNKLNQNYVTAFNFSQDYRSLADEVSGVTTTDFFTIQDSVGFGSIILGTAFGDVAFTSPNGNIFHPEAKFYLGLQFEMSIGFGSVFPIFGGSNQAEVIENTGSVFQPCSYVLRLTSGDVSCPLYFGSYGALDDPDSLSNMTGYDFIHEATEWFPYAKGAPVTPVWNTGTGLKL